MEKLNLNIPNQESLDLARKEKAEQLAANAKIRNFLYEEKIPVEMLERYPQRFSEWLDDREICENCTGLKKCKLGKNGYRRGLSYDGILQQTMEACPYRMKKEDSEAHLKNYIVSDLGEAFASVSFEAIRLEGEDRFYIQDLTTAIKACNAGKGLYLYGFMGTGKTYLAACAANQYARNGKQVAFVHCPAMMERFRSQSKDNEYQTEVSRLKYADFAVFDDIGAEEYNDRTRSILLSILEARMQNGRCTWFTSNYDFKTLEQHFVQGYDGNNRLDSMRILERIKTLAKDVELRGKDRRFVANEGQKGR